MLIEENVLIDLKPDLSSLIEEAAATTESVNDFSNGTQTSTLARLESESETIENDIWNCGVDSECVSI